jgi:hypothetical protein
MSFGLVNTQMVSPTVSYAVPLEVKARNIQELYLECPVPDQEAVTLVLDSCPDMRKLVVRGANATLNNLLLISHQATPRLTLAIPKANSLAKLKLRSCFMQPTSELRGRLLVELNLSQVDLKPVHDDFKLGGSNKCMFFRHIAEGCPALRVLKFSWPEGRSAPPPQIWGAAPTPAGFIARLPPLNFPQLESLEIVTADLTNADVVQIASNCFNLHTLVLRQAHSGSSYNMMEIPAEDASYKGLNDAHDALAMPQLTRLVMNLQAATDAVVSALVRGAPNLRILVSLSLASIFRVAYSYFCRIWRRCQLLCRQLS